MGLTKLFRLTLIAGSLFATSSWAQGLAFNPESNYVIKTYLYQNKLVEVRAYENIPYVTNPVKQEYQVLNIYIPVSYFNANEINGYSKTTAPILLLNSMDDFTAVKPQELPGKVNTPQGKQIAPATQEQAVTTSSSTGEEQAKQPEFKLPLDSRGLIILGNQYNLTLDTSRSTRQEVATQIGNLVQTARDGIAAIGSKVTSGVENVRRSLSQSEEQLGQVVEGEDSLQNTPTPEPETSLPENGEHFIAQALDRGYIVVSVGLRGSDSQSQGEYVGKNFAPLIDAKAAVKYLHFNQKQIPGDKERIIAVASHGGATIASLLGVSSDDQAYASQFEQLGAAQAPSSILGVALYAPYLNLEHADMAYEWGFSSVQEQQNRPLPGLIGLSRAQEFTPAQRQVSKELQEQFIAYLNSLALQDSKGKPYQLNSDGNGSFRTLVEQYIVQAANEAIKQDPEFDFSWYPWLVVQQNQATAIHIFAYQQEVGRANFPQSFDKANLSSPYNRFFGDHKENARHFTNFAQVANQPQLNAPSELVQGLNPSFYLEKQAPASKYWWIRHGTFDNYFPLALPIIFAQQLKQNKAEVDFKLAWNQASFTYYNVPELFAWIEQISKPSFLERTGAAVKDSINRLGNAISPGNANSPSNENANPEQEKEK
ncbi:hypothetical protein CJP74_03765 [Psittacicella melopsittaci]|uniref:BD-FAE-like domain-containing protein n=1 Tax=Psittacicella melopsittaci TaxID=2028576 RepID=A0A3A1Y329_9GAMM|nr:subtype B tannase [Psittacicella melopsittaci]RIY32732.1 hypothetical protein CJP74_03765 [Psittacicella melopsittaci]